MRVVYQCRTDALENFAWCQDVARKSLQLRIPKSGDKDLTELVRRIHRRVQAKSFKKTDFALALLAEDPSQWTVPAYIANGLRWLENELAPLPAGGLGQGGAGDEGDEGDESPGRPAGPGVAA